MCTLSSSRKISEVLPILPSSIMLERFVNWTSIFSSPRKHRFPLSVLNATEHKLSHFWCMYLFEDTLPIWVPNSIILCWWTHQSSIFSSAPSTLLYSVSLFDLLWKFDLAVIHCFQISYCCYWRRSTLKILNLPTAFNIKFIPKNLILKSEIDVWCVKMTLSIYISSGTVAIFT